ncbi:MAG: RNA-directed DNA polymerase, partial [Bacilli bacterium]|nr:RNA-directed DNA polymerase [Bacilli bacterium]
MSYKLTKKQLLFDLYTAFECAKKNKANKHYVKVFEENLHNNLQSLCNDLWERKYVAEPSTCFIITHPKRREVFAANFRDRVVHHLYYNYTHELFERTFIHDAYSCIKKRGTHFGIHRLEKHIRQESDNYKKPCHILKMDIKGYFMSINRQTLLNIVNRTLDKMSSHRLSKSSTITWNDVVDFCFIRYLSKEIILLDPTLFCKFRSDKSEWDELPKSKSLFHTPNGCGLPIGNLTSQLFSNVYLNLLDQYVKRKLKCRHYGRYVDDFYIVGRDKDKLKQCVRQIERFLETELGLTIQKGKTIINSMWQGVEFLGAYIKPYRTYISNQCLRRIRNKTSHFRTLLSNPINSVNSYLGIFSHYKSFNLRTAWFCHLHG